MNMMMSTDYQTLSDTTPFQFEEDKGFMEMLRIQADFSAPGNSFFDLIIPPDLITPANSVSISASSSSDNKTSLDDAGDEDVHNPNLQQPPPKQLKMGKRKNEKREKEARFAFMTKSEVDNLDDGYRWRKYGQKAVKNSPFPRNYYRCTTATCGVKKRVERSSEDPTIVVTTYEGQHSHPCPVVTRGGIGFNFSFPTPRPTTPTSTSTLSILNQCSTATESEVGAASFLHHHHHHHYQRQTSYPNYFTTTLAGANSTLKDIYSSSSSSPNQNQNQGNVIVQNSLKAQSSVSMHQAQQPRDDGLLQDIVPSKMRN